MISGLTSIQRGDDSLRAWLNCPPSSAVDRTWRPGFVTNLRDIRLAHVVPCIHVLFTVPLQNQRLVTGPWFLFIPSCDTAGELLEQGSVGIRAVHRKLQTPRIKFRAAYGTTGCV